MILRGKQQAFVDCYNGNATEAAIAAGYSAKTARVKGCQLLTKINIQYANKSREDKPRALRIATREERQAFWTNVMNGNVKDIAFEKGTKIDIDVKMTDRLKAAELLGRSEADFTDNTNISGRPTVIIKDLTGE